MAPFTTWYVEPLDAHSNEVISRTLSADNAAALLPCESGKGRNLWFCDYAFAKKMQQDQIQLQVRVRIWRRRGSGKIEKAPNFSKLKKGAKKKRTSTKTHSV